MDVAARGDVEVVLRDFFESDDSAEFLFFPPGFERVGDAEDSVVGKIVFRVAFGELATGVEEEELAFAVVGLGLVEKENNAGGGGVIEKILWQINDAFDEVLFDEPFAHVFFFVGVRVAGAAGGGAGVEYDGSSTGFVQ